MAQFTWNYVFEDRNITFVAEDMGNGEYKVISATGTIGQYTVTGLGNANNAGNNLYTNDDDGLRGLGISVTISDGTSGSAGYQYNLAPVSVFTQNPDGSFTVESKVYETFYDGNGDDFEDNEVTLSFTTNAPNPCFFEGTRIATPDGDVVVESLAAGDMIMTAGGTPKEVRWVGSTELKTSHRIDREAVLPIRIRAGAIDDSMPFRDLLVSPGHALQIDGITVNAVDLVNGRTIIQEDVDTARYYHVELHEVDWLIAEGMPAESYVDEGNRSSFLNSGTVVDLTASVPESSGLRAGQPVARLAPELLALRQRLEDRAGTLGWSLWEDRSLSLQIDGQAIAPTVLTTDRAWFALPETSAGTVRLVSPAARPAGIVVASEDTRLLGLCITEVRVDGVLIDLNSPSFLSGFYGTEEADGGQWRWTNGDGALRVPHGASMIEVRIIRRASSVLAPERVQAIAA